MEQNRVKRERYDKRFLDSEAIYCNTETFCLIETTGLNLETMDVIYAL